MSYIIVFIGKHNISSRAPPSTILKSMNVWFVSRSEIAPAIWQYAFRVERPVDFEPGQYIDLILDSVTKDRRGNKRTFSITSQPGEVVFSFVVKHFALQSFYKQALEAMQLDDKAVITDAMGDLILPKSPEVPLVFIAGGIGMASYASILNYLLINKEERQIFLYYQLRTIRERIFKDTINHYPLALSQTILTPNKIAAAEILSSTPPDSLFYISGSQSFVENLRNEMESSGVPRSQIVFDYYEGYLDL